MKTRLLLLSLSLCALLPACVAGGGGAGSARAGAPAGSPGSPGSSATSVPVAASPGASSTARNDGSADTGAPAKTTAEQQADLDGKLDTSLDRFDEQLRREQQRTATERDTRAAARADGAVVDAATGTNNEGKTGSEDIHRDRAGDLQSAGVQQDTAPADSNAPATADDGVNKGPFSKQGGLGQNSREIPAGTDDDIVARRLRRAAENETDPELKDKLWKEYLDYKQNTQGAR